MNPEKANFVFKEITFLGYLVSKYQIKIDPDRVTAIKEFKLPKDIKGLRRFLGMTSYWSMFIPKYADIACPLNDLKKTYV